MSGEVGGYFTLRLVLALTNYQQTVFGAFRRFVHLGLILNIFAEALDIIGLQCLSAFRPLGTAGSLNAYGIRVKRPVLTDLRNPGENRYSK